ncbi:leucine-rich repeat protein kinase family protein [Actinidia rufa]|uniref:Leucine-rich repeat protein kinase family protein n=1 Tax=Actinidia rufa TaxID=165716 RepID=A0A7J0F3I9_9ERIC|nr:leucine-rich repeat protein kinase family protein [Actinidia rufa]
MSHNSLTGMLPPEVGNLKVLVILDVSYNKLSGEIPSTLGRCFSLGYLYRQENFFNGKYLYRHPWNIPSMSEVPRGGVFCNASAAEVYSNIKICGGISELRLHRCPMQGPEKPGKHTTLKLVLVIVIPALFTGLTYSLLLLYWTR